MNKKKKFQNIFLHLKILFSTDAYYRISFSIIFSRFAPLVKFNNFGLIFLSLESKACTCDGIEISQNDQKHCYQIIRNTGNSWVNADEKCSSIGGFLAHINATTLYDQLNVYISQAICFLL